MHGVCAGSGMSQVWAWRAFDRSSVEALVQEEWSHRGRSPGGRVKGWGKHSVAHRVGWGWSLTWAM